MRTAKLLMLLVLFTGIVKAQTPKKTAATTPAPATANQLPSDEFFEHFTLKHNDTPTPEGYGLSPGMLIPIGAYVEDLSNQDKINQQLGRFFKTFLWADGTPLVFVDHKSSLINTFNVDVIRVTKPAGKDTISLYADEYKAEPVHLLKGFKFYTKEQFATEMAPILADVHTYLNTADRYTNAKSKDDSFKLLAFIQTNVGLDFMMDQEYLSTLLNDIGVDMDLKAFLIRSYMFHKLELMGTGQTNPQVKSFNAMVDDYQTVIKTQDIMLKGQLATYMVKR